MLDNSKNPVAVDPLTVMLEARSVALVGASPRAGSLGARMTEEVAKSASRPRTYLVNPRYDEIGGARTRRAFGFTLAVSSGQELVTPAAAYARYALPLAETKILALVLETVRDAAALRYVFADAAARDLPVFLLAAGTSEASRSLVAAHSGALAAGDGAWQALTAAYGVHRVGDLAELADALELFSLVRRPARPAGGTGHSNDPDRGCCAVSGGICRCGRTPGSLVRRPRRGPVAGRGPVRPPP